MRSCIQSTIVLALLSAARWTFAEEVPQPQENVSPSATVPHTVLPYEARRSPGHVARLNASTTSNPPQASATSSFAIQRIESLRKAAELLEKAGLADDASTLRKKISEGEQPWNQTLLAEKVKALAVLQAEIDDLQIAVKNASQIMLSVQVLEVSLTKMRDVGFDFSTVAQTSADSKPEFKKLNSVTTLDQLQSLDSATLAGVIQALRKSNLAKVSVEPTIVGLIGRPMSFQAGGAIPTSKPKDDGSGSVEYVKFGTMIDAVALKRDNDKLNIEFRLELSEIDVSLSRVAQDGQTIPGLRKRMVDTAMEAHSGQAFLFRFGSQWRVETSAEGKERMNEVETIVIVTPTFPVDGSN